MVAAIIKSTSFEHAGFVSNPQPYLERVPLPGPQDDVRLKHGMTTIAARCLKGDAFPPTSSVLISNSKYLNNTYYRDAYVAQSLHRRGHDLVPTYIKGSPRLGGQPADVSRPLDRLADRRDCHSFRFYAGTGRSLNLDGESDQRLSPPEGTSAPFSEILAEPVSRSRS